MKIKEAEILNYRSCVKTKFELQEKLTALIGINGVGKSNILNALLLLKKSNFALYTWKQLTKIKA